MCILQHAARHVWHEPVCGFTDYAADFCNQLAVRPSELWLTALTWLDDDERLSFLSELRLSVGLSAASNVAQRFSHALVDLFYAVWDKSEEAVFATETDPTRLRWLK